MGVADKHSIAWGITKAFHDAGANIVLTYQNERLKGNVEKLADSLDRSPTLIGPCDVTKDEELDGVFGQVSDHFEGKLDVMVHALAFAAREDLRGEFVNTSRSGAALALDKQLFPDSRGKPGQTAHGSGRGRQHHHPDLSRQRTSGQELQHHGCG